MSQPNSIKARLGEPDHEMGYRDATLRERLTPDEYAGFSKWMGGQTVCGDGFGGMVCYTYDVKRYFRIIPGKEVFD